MQETINERLKILIDALGTNPGALSRMLGISASTLRNYTDRDSKPGYEVLEKLYHSFKHINLYWLFGDGGEPLLPNAGGANGSVSNNKKFSRSLVVNNLAGGSAIQNHGSDAARVSVDTSNDKDILIEQLRSQLADKERTIQILLNKL